MIYTTDLHTHSKYANATSPSLTLPNIAIWAKKKGIDVIGTGDFSHPKWLEELKANLQYDDKTGLYVYQDVNFIFTNEVSLFYKDRGKQKKIHMVLIVPGMDSAEKLNKALSKYGDLSLDGRPVLGLSCKDLVKLVYDLSPECEVIPAHIWTPWFGVMGERFGYDDLESCFKEELVNIHAIETGLNSDPYMNWL